MIPFIVFFAIVAVASLVAPFVSKKLPKDFRVAGALLGWAGIAFTLNYNGLFATWIAGASLALGIHFARRAWREYSENAVIERGERAIARAEAAR
jgi:drug/metabolite transporter (DMT)-like permease